jgi:hypothetical protein
MSVLNVRLPASLHAELKVVSGEEEVSMNQLILLAVAEKLAARRVQKQLEAPGTLARRQQKIAGRPRAQLRGEFESLMSARAGQTPVEGDELPAGFIARSPHRE